MSAFLIWCWANPARLRCKEMELRDIGVIDNGRLKKNEGGSVLKI